MCIESVGRNKNREVERPVGRPLTVHALHTETVHTCPPLVQVTVRPLPVLPWHTSQQYTYRTLFFLLTVSTTVCLLFAQRPGHPVFYYRDGDEEGEGAPFCATANCVLDKCKQKCPLARTGDSVEKVYQVDRARRKNAPHLNRPQGHVVGQWDPIEHSAVLANQYYCFSRYIQLHLN